MQSEFCNFAGMIEKFHRLESEATAVELPQRFTCPFCYEPHPLALMAVEQVQRYVASRNDWAEEMGAGKMLGVLVARDREGRLGYLVAFSGNLAGSVHHDFLCRPSMTCSIRRASSSRVKHRLLPSITKWHAWNSHMNWRCCCSARKAPGNKWPMKWPVSRR